MTSPHGRVQADSGAAWPWIGLIWKGSTQPGAVADPDIPTIAETIPGYGIFSLFALIAPAGTPAPVIQRPRAAMDANMLAPALQERLRAVVFGSA